MIGSDKHQTNPPCMGEALVQQPKNQNSLIRFSLTLWFLRGAQDPIPSRTRPSNSSAPMVLSLKAWESRSLQGLPKTYDLNTMSKQNKRKPALETVRAFCVQITQNPTSSRNTDKTAPARRRDVAAIRHGAAWTAGAGKARSPSQRRGSSIQKVAPWPGGLSKPIRPPICSISSRLICRPRPLP